MDIYPVDFDKIIPLSFVQPGGGVPPRENLDIASHEEEIERRLGITKTSHPGYFKQKQEERIAAHILKGSALRKSRNIQNKLALSVPSMLSGEVIALRAISNGALNGAELPKRIKVLNWGVNETVSKGEVKVGTNTLAALAANQEKLGFDQVALDYNHNSLPGHPNFQADPRKTAAYGGLEVIAGDGVYMKALSYTPSGTENAREYRDLSPAVLLDDAGEVVFIHSVALCPQGEVKGLSSLHF